MVAQPRSVYQRHRFIVHLLVFTVIVYGALTVHIERNFPDIANGFDRQYSPVAENLVRFGSYSMGVRDATGNLVPTASVPPLYTVLYAASFSVFGFGRAAFEAMRILQILFGIGTILVVWRIGKEFSDRAGKIAAFFATFDLTAFYFANNFETPDVTIGFFMALWFLYSVKLVRGEPSRTHMLLSALFLGLATWTKVVVAFLWIPWGIFLAVFLMSHRRITWRKRWVLLGITAIVFAVFVGGWGFRNYRAIGYATLGSSSTPLRWDAAHLIAYQQGISLTEARKRLADQYVTEDVVRLGEGAADQRVSRAMASIILRSPVDYAVVTLRALPGLFLGTFPPYMLFSTQGAQELMTAVTEAHGFRTLVPRLMREGRFSYVLIYAGAKLHLIVMFLFVGVACILLARRASSRWVLAIALLMIAYTIIASGAAAQTRHRTIVFPIFYVLGGYGAAYLWERFHERQRSTAFSS